VRIEVKLFAAARQAAGAENVEVDLPEGATVADLRRALGERFPGARTVLSHAMFAIDMEYVNDNAGLRPHTEIACIPPVSGG
jgi:molybdopterin converting factor subunit 1